jgi:hypothetical protein
MKITPIYEIALNSLSTAEGFLVMFYTLKYLKWVVESTFGQPLVNLLKAALDIGCRGYLVESLNLWSTFRSTYLKPYLESFLGF